MLTEIENIFSEFKNNSKRDRNFNGRPCCFISKHFVNKFSTENNILVFNLKKNIFNNLIV